MTEHPESVVIAGAGQAGLSIAQTLRAEGYRGPITLLGEEPDPPYQRPPLSKKYLLGALSAERLLLKPAGYYDDAAIRLLTATRAEAIDRRAGILWTSAGPLPYGALALATGARPRRLPEAMGGQLAAVHTLRTRADIDRIAPEMRPDARLLVVGGGYIGLEAAAVAADRGLRVTLIELAPRILARVACAETAAALRALHEAHGVEIREGTALERLEGDGRVREARLADGSRLPVDLAIIGIGVTPNTELAETADLAIENGIATDATARSSDPAIWAAGDCASFPWKGGRIRLESVQNAIDQGAHAARAMLGDPAPYRPHPWFWSDQYDARLQIAGLGTGHDRIVARPGARPGGRSFWYFRGPELLAVDAISDPKAYMQGKRWIEAGHTPDPDRLADPGIDLHALG
ncbi:MAG: NAD(P)/FAD-dependent oxidoreductase [Paracoccaceae bacterium]